MSENETDFRLKRAAQPLPSKKDFTEDTGCLDAESAWENFGGLTLSEAYELLQTNTIQYAGDFMWMGSKAFIYYFPVVDRYLREVKAVHEGDDCEASILGHALEAQMNWNTSALSPKCVAETKDLAEFVLQNVDRYLVSQKGSHKFLTQWERIIDETKTYRRKK